MADLPKKIARYEILEEISRGGMGVVYKARDPNLNRLVALKIIKLAFEADEDAVAEMRERFRREASAAGVLLHPNIVTVYDAGEDNGVPFIAMEYVVGQTLDKLAGRGELLPVDQVCAIIRQAANGIAFANDKGIIHRDIKPGNIIVTEDGTAKIMDFGIAKIPHSDLTQKGAIMGSTSYMSPEQVTGGDLDQRSDLFSLGVVFYQLLTGEKPFPGDNATSISFRIVRIDPVEPTKINPVIDPAYNVIIRRALAKRPEERYSSAREMAEDLTRVMEGRRLEPEPKALISSPQRPLLLTGSARELWRRPAVRWSGFGLFAAAVIFGLVLLVVLTHNPYAAVEKLSQDGNHPQAVAELLQLQTRRPEDPRAPYLLGQEYFALQDFFSSFLSYEQALKLNPEYKTDEGWQNNLLQYLALAPPDAASAVPFVSLAGLVGDTLEAKLQDALHNPDYNTHWNAFGAFTGRGHKVDELPLLIMDVKTSRLSCELRDWAVNRLKALDADEARRELKLALKESDYEKACNPRLAPAIRRPRHPPAHSSGGKPSSHSAKPAPKKPSWTQRVKKIFKPR